MTKKRKKNSQKKKERVMSSNTEDKENPNGSLELHNYAAMETAPAGPDKRQLDESPENSLAKNTHVRKWVRPNDSSFEAIMSAINNLDARFDKQMLILEDNNSRIRENSVMIGSLATALEFNAAEIKECKSKVAMLEEKVVVLEKDNLELKQKAIEQESYSRRWNLRIKGMKEKLNENTREEVIELLKKVAPHWAQTMENIVDTVHRVGRKEEKNTRPVIIQFVKRQHRDGIWRITKESAICKEAGVHFTEDLTTEVKKIRDVLWPRILEARQAGKKAYFRGPYGFINGKRI